MIARAAADRRLRHRPRGVLAAVRGAARAARGLPGGARAQARRPRRRGRLRGPRRYARRGPRGGRATRRCTSRARDDLYGDVRDVLAGAAGSASGEGPGRDPEPAADALGRLRRHDHRRMARQLLGLLRPRARRSLHPRPCPLQHRHRDAPRRRPRVGRALGDWIAATGAVQSLRASRFGFLGHNYPGMLDMYSDFTQLHAQTGLHVEILEIDDLVERVEAVDADAIERKSAEIDELFARADPGLDPIADEITPERFDWAARVARGPRPARRRLRARRADLLLPRSGRKHERAGGRRADRRQLAPHRPRDPDLRRGRHEDQCRDVPARPARGGRVVHRVLRARLRRGVRPDGT